MSLDHQALACIADVALVDAKTAAASGSISISQFHELVRLRKAPQPAVRSVRCTRWRLADIRSWLIEWADNSTADTANAENLAARAKKASAAARTKRAPKLGQSPVGQ